jgi:hypothetical protein
MKSVIWVIVFQMLVAIAVVSTSAAEKTTKKLAKDNNIGMTLKLNGWGGQKIEDRTSGVVATRNGIVEILDVDGEKWPCFEKNKGVLRIRHQNAINLINNFGIICRICPEKIDSYRTILWKGNRRSEPQQIQYYLNLRDGDVEFKMKDHNGRWIVYSTVGQPVKIGVDYKIKVEFRSGRVLIAVNSRTWKFKPKLKALTASLTPLFIGRGDNANRPAFGFDGLITEITFYPLKKKD